MATKKQTATATDKFDWLTERFISLLEKGVNPWRTPWRTGKGSIMNFATGKAYNGKNPLILAMDTLFRGAELPYYCGLSQGSQYGWKLKKGSKAAYVTYANVIVKEGEGDNEDKAIPFVKWSAVFHVEDWTDDGADKKIIDCFPTSENINPDERINDLENFVAQTGARIKTLGQPYYNPDTDTVVMPAWENFESKESYYATLLHELTHWTGHETRLDRKLANRFGTPAYAREELIAEMGAALLCQHFGINSSLENHASYIGGWLAKAKEDKMFLYRSMGEARKAYEMLTA